ncbi:ADP-ribosyl cyclase/cyclic ADP-ribose hydrolase [Citrus sinensis]|uniref:ADP-ribosyl cyclase/cyclic ADP-ribose hydrolase n=1 Tax=Citrus sinensis TaxID=2711 RepID=A0ACB8M8G4_CITSI|nr:ADP-ribosyl cyclase/cyclic ADP-ribose hydrolase [Citrus sinensis]
MLQCKRLEERFKENSEKLQTWRNTLKEAAGLSGSHSRTLGNQISFLIPLWPESELVKEVVNQNLKRLAEVSPCSNKNQLVEVESRVEEIESLLGAGSKDVYALGIWGIGGIGKTTIARAIFDKISSNFEGSCCHQNVREESRRPGGLGCLQQILLSKLLQEKNAILDIALSFRRLSSRKFLIVLDDETCFKQIKSLIGMLRNCSVKEKYEMKELGDDHALELFSFEELSSRVIKYAQGVPLAIEILGCFLFEKEKQFWESAINKLKRIPNLEIQKVLKISFDGLDDEEKNILLDIACFFKWKNKDLVIKFLNACSFTAQIGISSLVDKSLICMHGNNITMHDLLQEMGREIVRQESMNDPAKRSRLWHHEDIIKVLTSNTGTEAIEGICLDMYFHWHGYPLKSLPSNIHPEKLVLLEMPHSNIQQLWDGVLVCCSKLRWLPDISSAANIEEMLLNGTAIEELPSSIECLYKLLHLDLEDCKSLKSLPSGLCKLKSLKYLTLNGCSNLQRLPDELRNLEALWSSHAIGTAIREVPSSVFRLNNIDLLSFQRSRGHKQMGLSLPIMLSLDGLHTLNRIPESIIQLCKLGRLYLRYCERLQSLQKLPCKLHELDAHHCTALESLSGLFSSYEACTQYFDLSYNYKLDRNEIRGILEEALQEIQLLATATMERSKSGIYYSQKYALLVRVFFPGDEIPMWFSFQSWFGNKKVLGFAFSAIVAFGEHNVREKRWFELFCEFKVRPKDSHAIQRFMDYVESDHLLLGYYFFDHQDLNGFWKYNCILEINSILRYIFIALNVWSVAR